MFMQRIFYQVYMHDPVTKGYYYKKDMRILLAPNILNYIENFEKKSDIVLDTKNKNYLFDQIFEIQIEKNIFEYEDKDIFNILSTLYIYRNM